MIEETVLNDCARPGAYKALAECYYPPDETLPKRVDDLGKAYGGFFSEVVRSAPKIDDLGRHKVDYARLFLGPFKVLASPYGSVYLEDGQLMGNSTFAARALYEQEGLDIVLKDAPDHINVELEFMYVLLLKEIAAREKSDLREAARLREKQASFLQIHLGMWVRPFARNIERNAQTEFYKALGLATKSFVLADVGRLSEDCECRCVGTGSWRGPSGD